MASPETSPAPGAEKLTLELPVEDEVFRACKAHPPSIDQTLRDFMIRRVDAPFLSCPEHSSRSDEVGRFPDRLHHELLEFIDLGVTPELLWGGDPARPAQHYYMACFYATMLGRAYSITRELMGPMEGRLEEVMDLVERAFPNVVSRIICDMLSEWYRDVLRMRKGLWIVILEIMLKALGDSRSEEVALRYVASVLFLTAATVEENTAGDGDKALWEGADWGNLSRLLNATADLPRSNTDAEECRKRMENKERDPAVVHDVRPWIPIEYIPQQTLDALDMARAHIAKPERQNWTSEDVFENKTFQAHFDETLNPTRPRYEGQYTLSYPF